MYKITIKKNWRGDLFKKVDFKDWIISLAKKIIQETQEQELSGGPGKIQYRTGTLYHSLTIDFNDGRALIYPTAPYAPYVAARKYDFMAAGLQDAAPDIDKAVNQLLKRMSR